MKKRYYRSYKFIGKITILLAAAPLFQFSQCMTYNRQVWGTYLNNLPNTLFSSFQSLLLAPLQFFISGGLDSLPMT